MTWNNTGCLNSEKWTTASQKVVIWLFPCSVFGFLLVFGLDETHRHSAIYKVYTSATNTQFVSPRVAVAIFWPEPRRTQARWGMPELLPERVGPLATIETSCDERSPLTFPKVLPLSRGKHSFQFSWNVCPVLSCVCFWLQLLSQAWFSLSFWMSLCVYLSFDLSPPGPLSLSPPDSNPAVVGGMFCNLSSAISVCVCTHVQYILDFSQSFMDCIPTNTRGRQPNQSRWNWVAPRTRAVKSSQPKLALIRLLCWNTGRRRRSSFLNGPGFTVQLENVFFFFF